MSPTRAVTHGEPADPLQRDYLELEVARLERDKQAQTEAARIAAVRAQTIWPMIPALVFLGLGVALAYRYPKVFEADRWPASQTQLNLPPIIKELVDTSFGLAAVLIDVTTWAVNGVSATLAPVSGDIKSLVIAALTAVVLGYAAGRRWVTTAGFVTGASLVIGAILISLFVQHRAWAGEGPAPARVVAVLAGSVIWTWVLFHDFPTRQQSYPPLKPGESRDDLLQLLLREGRRVLREAWSDITATDLRFSTAMKRLAPFGHGRVRLVFLAIPPVLIGVLLVLPSLGVSTTSFVWLALSVVPISLWCIWAGVEIYTLDDFAQPFNSVYATRALLVASAVTLAVTGLGLADLFVVKPDGPLRVLAVFVFAMCFLYPLWAVWLTVIGINAILAARGKGRPTGLNLVTFLALPWLCSGATYVVIVYQPHGQLGLLAMIPWLQIVVPAFVGWLAWAVVVCETAFRAPMLIGAAGLAGTLAAFDQDWQLPVFVTMFIITTLGCTSMTRLWMQAQPGADL
jgi:hypothetical protein